MVLYIIGDEIRTAAEDKSNDDDDDDDDYDFDHRTLPDWFRLQFAGAIIAACFWVKL